MNLQATMQAAVARHEAGDPSAAASLYQEIFRQHPRHAQVMHLLGVAKYQLGDYAGAVKWVRRAIEVEPGVTFFYSNLAEILRVSGDARGAVEAGRRAVQLQASPNGYFNLALALLDAGDLDEAERSLGHVLSLDANHARAQNSLGALLQRRGDWARAERAFRRAVALDADFADAHHNLATVLRVVGRVEPAVGHFRAALALDPQSAETHNNLAEALRDQGMVEDAIAGFREAVRVKPGFVEAHSNLLYAMQFSPRFEAAEVFAAHREWAARHAEPLTVAAPAPPRRERAGDDGALRVGFVSPDLRNHPVGRFLLPILTGRDRTRFHVTCYAGGPPGADAMTASLREVSDAWRDVTSTGDGELAERIRADGIDVLIDLAGHTSHHRLLCFARRPAPVQATYLGYPDTTGMSAIDWRLTDVATDPPGMTEAFHTERLQRIEGCAWCYLPPDAAPTPVSPLRDVVHFGSFNNLAKISAATASRLVCRPWHRAGSDRRPGPDGLGSGASRRVRERGRGARHLSLRRDDDDVRGVVNGRSRGVARRPATRVARGGQPARGGGVAGVGRRGSRRVRFDRRIPRRKRPALARVAGMFKREGASLGPRRCRRTREAFWRRAA